MTAEEVFDWLQVTSGLASVSLIVIIIIKLVIGIIK